MAITDMFKTQVSKTYEEKLQEDEELDVDLRIAEKRLLLKRLKEQGLSMNDFGGSFKRAIQWLKTH
jgi:hypothetical protein